MIAARSPTEDLIALFAREGYARLEPAILQPAEIFVDLSGEDIRRRMFVTQDQAGRELCLRPEYTIPVCRAHLESGRTSARYSYLGPVFRLRAGETGEFLQAGIESIGRTDAAAADAEMLGIALEGLALLDGGPAAVRLGDMALLDGLIEALGLASAAKRRVLRAIAAGEGFAALQNPEPGAALDEHAGLLAAIEGQAPQAAKAFVEDILAIAGISRVGGRSAGEIATRFLDRAANRPGLGAEASETLRRYLAVQGPPASAAAEIRALARDAGLDLDPAVDAFEERTRAMAARGLEAGAFTFAADFVRSLDYYTGFIFEVNDAQGGGKPVVGGGRYDRLLRLLGSPEPVPAVGCAFRLDRIAAEAGA